MQRRTGKPEPAGRPVAACLAGGHGHGRPAPVAGGASPGGGRRFLASAARRPASRLRSGTSGRAAAPAGQDQRLSGLGRTFATPCAKPGAGAASRLLASPIPRRCGAPAGGQPARQPGQPTRHQRGNRARQHLDPPTAARGPGGLPHPGQRPVADGTGAGVGQLDRSNFDAGETGRPWPRRPVRRHRPDPHPGLVHLDFPGQAHPGRRPGREHQGGQGTAARRARQRHRLRHPALSGRRWP
ncbi:hypothetical protein D3C73_713560 [compost metagenome]